MSLVLPVQWVLGYRPAEDPEWDPRSPRFQELEESVSSSLHNFQSFYLLLILQGQEQRPHEIWAMHFRDQYVAKEGTSWTGGVS